jgi:hypothetical protein
MHKILWIVVLLGILGGGYYIQQNYLNSKKSVNDTSTTSVSDGSNSTVVNIVGSWASTDDAKSVEVFKEDRTTENVYDGKVITTGTWNIVKNTKLADGSILNGIFLETIIEKEQYVYKVVSVNDSELTLTYLSRGNTLNYKKIR